MASWVACPGCSLRHTARPDGVCPRCQTPVGPPEAAAPASPAEDLPEVYGGSVPPSLLRAEAALPDGKAPWGARLAGAIMIVNGLALVAEKGLGVATPTNLGANPLRFVFSFLLGGLVLSGSLGAIKVARVLTGLSGVVLLGLLLSRGQTLLAALQLAFTASLLLLLLGKAGGVRTATAAALAAAYFTLEGAGLYGVVSGRFPLARLMMAGQLEAGPVPEVSGAQVRYRLTVPEGSWYLRTEAAARKDNALADRWLVRPDRDWHVIVIAETLPAGAVVEMDRFRDSVVNNLTKGGKGFAVLDEGPLATPLEAGHLVHAKSESEGQAMEWLVGLYIQHPYIVQVLAFGGARAYPEVEPELKTIVSSLEL